MSTTCPACEASTIPIAYGMPGPEMVEAADRGEIVLGGCCVVVGPPGDERRQCSACERRWLASPHGAPVVLCAAIGGHFGESIVVCVDVDGSAWRNGERVGAVALDELWAELDSLGVWAWRAAYVDELWAELDSLGVWAWRAAYVDEAVLDGTSWWLRGHHGGRDLNVSGRNHGPQSFDRLCALLSRISGSAFA